jgi:hypothetical protein
MMLDDESHVVQIGTGNTTTVNFVRTMFERAAWVGHRS